MQILVVGHACSPVRGSEPGITWNHCWHLAQEHDVWLVTHPHYRDEVDAFLRESPNARLRIIWVTLPRWIDPWNPIRSERGLRLHYMLWQRYAARAAQDICQREKIELAHHVSWGTVNIPPRLARLNVPLVWGPLGGGETIPAPFRAYNSSWSGDLLRRAHCTLLPLRPAFRRIAKRVALALTPNMETKGVLERGGARCVELMLDCALPSGYAADASPVRQLDGEIRLLWAGRLEARKALPLALEALVKSKCRARLIIAGDGPLRDRYQRLASSLGLHERVQFLGAVPWDRMPQLFRDSHALIFTSLRDKFGSVVLEAMAHGLPVLTLNHQGVRCFVPDEAGIKVSVDEPEQTIRELAGAIDRLDSSPQDRLNMAQAALDFARTQTWTQRANMMVQRYERILRQVDSSIRR